jgi:hypothetical protein
MIRITFLLLMLLVCGYAYSQTTTDEKLLTDVTSTLVNNQLTPELVKLEYDGGISNGILNAADGKPANKFKQSIFTFSAFPAALIKEKNTQLYMGMGYTEQKFSGFTTDTYSSLFSESIKSFYMGAALSEKYGNHFFWLTYVQAGLNGTNPFQNIDKTFNAEIISKADYKLQSNLNLGLGIAYFTNGNPLVLPVVTFTYSQSKYIINFDFPIKTEIEAILDHGKIRPVAGVSYHGGNYYQNNYNQYLCNFGALGYFGARFKILDFLYFYATYQTGVYDQYKSGQMHNLSEIGTYAGQNQIVVSLNIQMARII